MNEWVLRVVSMVFSVMSPELRTSIVTFVKAEQVKAKKTVNPWDDIFYGVLASILNIKEDE